MPEIIPATGKSESLYKSENVDPMRDALAG
jgi:hypothetical protein